MCHAAKVFRTDCDVTDGSHPMIFLEKKRDLLIKIESHKKDHKIPRMKWRKVSESACHANAVGSVYYCCLG